MKIGIGKMDSVPAILEMHFFSGRLAGGGCKWSGGVLLYWASCRSGILDLNQCPACPFFLLHSRPRSWGLGQK